MRFHFLLLWVIFMHIYGSYRSFNENKVFNIFNGVAGIDLHAYNDLWFGCINDLHI